MFNPVSIVSEHDYIKSIDKYSLQILINFSNFSIYRPQIHENNGATKVMFPNEARLRNFTYSSNMTVNLDIQYIINNEKNDNQKIIRKTLKGIHIGKIPIMLKSSICILNQYSHLDSNITNECIMDPGGYFIINGSVNGKGNVWRWAAKFDQGSRFTHLSKNGWSHDGCRSQIKNFRSAPCTSTCSRA